MSSEKYLEYKELKKELEEGELKYYLEDPRPIQLVVRTKPKLTAFFRRKPITSYVPSEAQIRVRIAFGEAAKKAKGIKYVGLGVKPPASEYVREALKGRVFSKEYRPPKWLKILEKLVSR